MQVAKWSNSLVNRVEALVANGGGQIIKHIFLVFFVALFTLASAQAKDRQKPVTLFATTYAGAGSLKNQGGGIISYDASQISIATSGAITGTVNTNNGPASIKGKVSGAKITTKNASRQIAVGNVNIRLPGGVQWKGKIKRVDDKKANTVQITANGKIAKGKYKGKFSFANSSSSPSPSVGANGAPANSQGSLSGTIYYVFTRNIYKIDLASGKKTEIARRLPGVFEDFYIDVSRQNDEMLLIDSSGINYQYINLVSPTNTAVSNARFRVLENEIGGSGISKISPDKSKILLVWEMGEFPNARKGAFVFDRRGNELAFFGVDASGDRILEADWLPDGNLMLLADSGFYKTDDTTLQNASFVVKPSAGGYGYMSISPDGRRMAYRADGEIWTMNIDGTNQRQLTNSVPNVFDPTWSPDGRHICFLATKFIASTGPIVGGGGDLLQLVVAPADDKLYELSTDVFEVFTGTQVINGENLRSKNGLIIITEVDPTLATRPNVFSTSNLIWR